MTSSHAFRIETSGLDFDGGEEVRVLSIFLESLSYELLMEINKIKVQYSNFFDKQQIDK